MKKILNVNNLLYFILLLITFAFLCTWYDEFNRNTLYKSNYGYKYSDNLNISAKINVSSKTIEQIQNLTKKHNIILEKQIVTNKKKNITIHYLSLNNYTKICNLYKINCSNKKNFISTYKCKNCIVKEDFLNNDYHIFKLFDNYVSEQTNYTGEYKIFYNDKNDKNIFIQDLSKLLNIETATLLPSGYSMLKSNFDTLKNIYIISMLIIITSIFISSLFQTLKNSNKIGIYRLLGISNAKIIKNNSLTENKSALIITMITYILLNLLIPNNNIVFCLLSFAIILIIIILKLIITIISTYIICKKINLINLIKKEKITEQIIQFNNFFKILSFAIILISGLLIGIQLKVFIEKKNDISSFIKYSNYAVFSQFYQGEDYESLIGGNNNLDKAELELFKYLEKFDVIYVDFRGYFPKTKEEKNQFKMPTANGNKKYQYGIIDTKYLKDLNLTNANTGKKITINDNTKNNIFLIPNSLSNEIKKFKDFYYEYYEYNEKDQFIIYKDTDIPTLSPEIAKKNHYLIKSPIMKVITTNNVGLQEVSIYGVGYDTPLKIKVNNNNDKQKFFQTINDKLAALQLADNLKIDTFYSYSELFNNELNEIIKQIIIFLTIMTLISIIYTYIVIQSIILYLRDKYKEVAIKKLNGFSNSKIFKKYILHDLLINNLLMIIIFTIFHESYNITEFLIIFIFINLFEQLLNLTIIKIKLNKFIVKAIKGGEL